jgi:hypothetical protein
MYHLKMEKQMNNARSARMPTPPELFVGNKNSLLLSLLQVNNQINNQSTRASQRQRRPTSTRGTSRPSATSA